MSKFKRTILEDAFASVPATPLYHYTTQQGVLGIINDEEIWATHTQYLNDTREFLHALQIVEDEVKSMSASVSPDRESTLKEIASCGVDKTAAQINVCVTSFSEDPDSLSQWRAYAGPGPGFAVGIDGEHLRKLTCKNDFYLGRCLYQEADQRALMKALIEEVVDEIILWRVDPPSSFVPIGGNFRAYLNRYAPLLKDPSFSVEREWRIVSRPLMCTQERFSFRPGKSMLVPYYRFPLSDSTLPFNLHAIVVGPTPTPEQSERSIRSLLVRKHLRNVDVVPSRVPYRGW